MNFIFSFTNKYINIEITIAVEIAFPVFMLANILVPRLASSNPAFEAVTNKYTRLLFIYNKNLMNRGARKIKIQPKVNLIRFSFISFFLDVFIPTCIILKDKIITAISIRVPDIMLKM